MARLSGRKHENRSLHGASVRDLSSLSLLHYLLNLTGPSDRPQFWRKQMLQEMLEEMISVYAHRRYSQTVYSGWGTIVDRLIDEYLEMGGSRMMVRCIASLAYHRAHEN